MSVESRKKRIWKENYGKAKNQYGLNDEAYAHGYKDPVIKALRDRKQRVTLGHDYYGRQKVMSNDYLDDLVSKKLDAIKDVGTKKDVERQKAAKRRIDKKK